MKKFRLTRDSFAVMCAKAEIMPVHRESYRDYDIIIGDGKTLNPERVLARFGVGKDDFPLGCFCTAWAICKGDKIALAGILPNKLTHDVQYDERSKQIARVAGGITLAKKHIDLMRAVAAKGIH